MRGLEGLTQLCKRGADGAGKLFGARGWEHALGPAHEERIFETGAQPGDGVAESRLAEADPFCGAADVAFVGKSFKGEQEIEVDPADIHRANIAYNNYPFHK